MFERVLCSRASYNSENTKSTWDTLYSKYNACLVLKHFSSFFLFFWKEKKRKFGENKTQATFGHFLPIIYPNGFATGSSCWVVARWKQAEAPVAGSHWLSTVCAAKLRVVPGARLNLLSREDVRSVGLGKLLLKVHLFPKSCFNQQLKIYVILVYNQTIEV